MEELIRKRYGHHNIIVVGRYKNIYIIFTDNDNIRVIIQAYMVIIKFSPSLSCWENIFMVW